MLVKKTRFILDFNLRESLCNTGKRHRGDGKGVGKEDWRVFPTCSLWSMWLTCDFLFSCHDKQWKFWRESSGTNFTYASLQLPLLIKLFYSNFEDLFFWLALPPPPVHIIITHSKHLWNLLISRYIICMTYILVRISERQQKFRLSFLPSISRTPPHTRFFFP